MQQIIDYLINNDNFLITSHVAPDGDNIGSSIALCKFLQNIGKNTYHVLDDNAPQSLSYITSKVKIYKSSDVQNLFNNAPYNIVVLDCGNKVRVCIDKKILDNAVKVGCIDHHESNELFGDINYLVKTASSTCEIVYQIMKKIDETKIDEIVATALYTGLATDTGHFKFDCTSQSSFYMAADLLSKNAKKQDVVKNIYQSDDYNYKRMEASLVLNEMEKLDEICVMTLTQDILSEFGIDMKDTEDLVNNTLNIQGVELGILLKEKSKNIVKGSLRSKQRVDCNQIAKHFGGGGHIRAAGFTINDINIEDAKKLVLDYVKNYV